THVPADLASMEGRVSAMERTTGVSVSLATRAITVIFVRLDPCGSSPCDNGGSCYHSVSAPTQFVCTCPLGYNGTLCQTAIGGDDPCLRAPCQHGGVCFNSADVPTEYVCTCPSEFTGKNCETSLSGLIGR
ncbi:hypothetical protein BaRGS_00039360, partial [Batillaria attramentaria]